MAQKRSNSKGCVYQRADGRWEGVVQLGFDGQGKRKKKSVYGQTRDEVQRKMIKVLAQHQDGTLPMATEKQTVSSYLSSWLQDDAAATVRSTTFESYTRLVNRHICPEIGRVPLVQLKPAHLQALYARKRLENLSPRTVQYIHAILRRALGQAVKLELLTRSPALAISPPRVPKYDARFLSSDEASRFLAANVDDELFMFYYLALMTGMRRGELLGLRWTDVDFDHGVLHVQKAMVREKGKGHVLSEPKTKRSARPIALPEMTTQLLRDHQAAQAEQKRVAGGEFGDNNLVFSSAVGQPLDSAHVSRHMRVLCSRAGLPAIRLHDLRHTSATLLLSQGVHPKVVSERLGHSTIAMTLNQYSHVLPTLQQEAAAKLGQVLDWRNSGTKETGRTK